MVPARRPPWLLSQQWSDLLFAHWPVDPERLARTLPAGVVPDVFDDRAWIAIVAFRMLGSRPAAGPPGPTLPPIPELNVRTYVRVGGVPGVWFISLDASSPFFAAVGRALYGLPYRVARMSTISEGGRTHYMSSRRDACFAATYEPCGEVSHAEAGSLEHFLVERYRLFSMRRGQLVTAVVTHEPWPLQPAVARLHVNRMAPHDLDLRGRLLLHFVGAVDARISVPQAVSPVSAWRWRRNAGVSDPVRV
jgi:uncharacterized protein YqjF (DUF2071 family)